MFGISPAFATWSKRKFIVFRCAVTFLPVVVIQFLTGSSGTILFESAPEFFQSSSICGGHTRPNQRAHALENLTVLTDTATHELLDAAVFTGDIINCYKERVRFTHTGIPCVSNFSRTIFQLSTGSYDNDIGPSIRHDYLETFKLLSVLQFLISEENKRQSESETERSPDYDRCFIDKPKILRGHLYEALCSMNKALRRLDYRGDAVSRQVYIRRTTNMCIMPNSTLDGYARDLELFRMMRTASRTLFDRFYSRKNNCTASVSVFWSNGV